MCTPAPSKSNLRSHVSSRRCSVSEHNICAKLPVRWVAKSRRKELAKEFLLSLDSREKNRGQKQLKALAPKILKKLWETLLYRQRVEMCEIVSFPSRCLPDILAEKHLRPCTLCVGAIIQSKSFCYANTLGSTKLGTLVSW